MKVETADNYYKQFGPRPDKMLGTLMVVLNNFFFENIKVKKIYPDDKKGCQLKYPACK